MLNKGDGIIKSYALYDGKYSLHTPLNFAINAIIKLTHILVSNF